ncbi:hypothetical protein [Sphingomonas ginkgonis]|nr:hypothetical protein [Sphingomonas ginkgonis]
MHKVSTLHRTLIAAAAALLMSSVAVGSAVGPATASYGAASAKVAFYA